MPQMKPLYSLFIFMMVIFSLMILISFLYFFTLPDLTVTTPPAASVGAPWTWKW